MYHFDPIYWILIGPAMLLAIFAQIKVQATFARYSRVATQRGITGAQAAQRILADAGIDDVKVEEVGGWLSDHYDPRSKTLRLSPGVYHSRSIAAVGVAAHEVGHAMQHAQGYAAMKLRTFMVPAASVGSWLAIPLIFIGFFINSLGLIKFGIVFFGAVVAFQIVTLPVEFNASTRARAALATSGVVVTQEEESGVRSVLSAAAMTYVAATMVAVMQLIYFLMVANRRR
jgi:hypothetical protein